MPSRCPCIAVNTCDDLFVLSTELPYTDRKTERERMGPLAAGTPDSAPSAFVSKGWTTGTAVPMNLYPTSMAGNLLRNLHMQNQTHSFMLRHHPQEVRVSGIPPTRTPGKSSHKERQIQRLHKREQHLCWEWYGHMGQEERPHTPSLAPSLVHLDVQWCLITLIIKGQGSAETSPLCWAIHSTRACRLFFSKQKYIARCKAVTL